MIQTRIKLEEQSKGVTADVELTSSDHTPEELLVMTQELMNKALEYTKNKTLRKVMT